MRERRLMFLLTTAALMGGLTACSSFFGPDVVVRPVEKVSTESSHNALYDGAVAAIDDRNYGRALDYLQAAKERNPNDIKILNALGVVYDKLGRFDLSSRYYAQAASLDPGSRIVAANTAYSRALQNLVAPAVAASAAPTHLAETKAGSTPVQMAAAAALQHAPMTKGAGSSAPEMILPAVNLQSAAAVKEALPAANLQPAPVMKVAPPTANPRVTPVKRETPSGANLQLAPMKVALPTVNLQSAPAMGETPSAANLQLAPMKVVLPTVNLRSAPAINLQPAMKVTQHVVNSPPPPLKETPRTISPQTVPTMGVTYRTVKLQPALAAVAIPHRLVLTGHPLVVTNGIGREAVGDLVRLRLATLGWTVAKTPGVIPRGLTSTTIIYQEFNLAAAQALARTLPFPARLTVNSCNCGGLELVLGTDFKDWKARSRLTHKADSIVAAVTPKQVTGVR